MAAEDDMANHLTGIYLMILAQFSIPELGGNGNITTTSQMLFLRVLEGAIEKE